MREALCWVQMGEKGSLSPAAATQSISSETGEVGPCLAPSPSARAPRRLARTVQATLMEYTSLPGQQVNEQYTRTSMSKKVGQGLGAVSGAPGSMIL